MPNKALSPTWGKSVGGVSERAGVRAQEEPSFGEEEFAKNESLTCRGGERHPGLLEGGALRGASLEWRPRSARIGASGFLRGYRARRWQRMSEGSLGGERRRPTPNKRRNRTQARDTVACGSGRVLHWVLRPVLVDPHYAPRQKPGWWGALEDIAARQTG